MRAVGSWESLVRVVLEIYTILCIYHTVVVLEIYRQMMVGQGIPQEDRGPFRFRTTGQLTCLPTGWLSQYLTQKLLPELSTMSAVLDFQLCSDREESAMGRTCDHMTPYDSCRAFHLIQNKSMWHHREIHVTPSEGMRQLQDMWMCDISLVSLARFQWEIWNYKWNTKPQVDWIMFESKKRHSRGRFKQSCWTQCDTVWK